MEVVEVEEEVFLRWTSSLTRSSKAEYATEEPSLLIVWGGGEGEGVGMERKRRVEEFQGGELGCRRRRRDCENNRNGSWPQGDKNSRTCVIDSVEKIKHTFHQIST